MQIEFYKYQGTGNDFIILDNRKKEYSLLGVSEIHSLCDRRYGIVISHFKIVTCFGIEHHQAVCTDTKTAIA